MQIGISIILCMLILSLIVGYITIKKIEPTNPFVTPFTQDSIEASILFYTAFQLYIEGDPENAHRLLNKSIELRKRWQNE